MLQLVKVKILDDITISHDGRYFIQSDIVEMTKKDAESLAKKIQIQILDNDNKEPSPGMSENELRTFYQQRRKEKPTTQKHEPNELQKLLQKFETK